MLRQYRKLKGRYPDALLLYRLGDFYELFEADAKLVARELGLALTTRRFAKEVRLPMCGIPHHRLTGYLGRLIRLGHKIAIVEQLEDARKTKQLVKRDVVRVITPGTVVEDALLRDSTANLLAGIAVSPRGYGLATIDLSTGKFSTTQIVGPDPQPALWEELIRLGPSEVVYPSSLADQPNLMLQLETVQAARLSPLDDHEFRPERAAERLKTHLGVASLEGFGCDGLPEATAAAGGVLSYLQNNQISDLAHIVRLSTYDLSSYVNLDAITRRNLELVRTLRDVRRKGSLYDSLDRTMTAMGRRMLQSWLLHPLLDLEPISLRQDAVQELVERALLRAELRQTLDGLYDIERLVGRIGFGNANARDLVALRQSLDRIPRIQALLARCRSRRLCQLNEAIDADTLGQVCELVIQAIVDEPPILLREGGLIRTGYKERLDCLRQVVNSGQDWMAQYETEQRERTGIKNLRIRYNQVFGFFIEVTKSNLGRVPADYERRATVRNAERFATPELKRREAEIIHAQDQIVDLEYELFAEIRRRIAAESRSLTHTAQILAELDVLAALAEVAALQGFVRPTVDRSNTILIRGGRHPVVEHHLADGERFVPNDTTLDADQRLMILTGPNMSGKSVYIRQVALIALLAQIGSFVPAAQAQIGLVDRIFVRAGASDDITQGRSTFMVEMSETSYILHHATDRSLVVLDEVGRGTSTYDGMSIAWAVAEELHDAVGARTLFATHFHELTDLTHHLNAARNYSLAVTQEGHRVLFMRQLVPGGADKSYGIAVARLAGLPEHVIERAEAILAKLEQNQEAPPSESQPLISSQVNLLAEPKARPITAPPPETAPPASINKETLWALLQELSTLDIANMTPVQALVLLNELQARLNQA
jgi:DNA mismatch repair protein MutS